MAYMATAHHVHVCMYLSNYKRKQHLPKVQSVCPKVLDDIATTPTFPHAFNLFMAGEYSDPYKKMPVTVTCAVVVCLVLPECEQICTLWCNF